MTSVEISALNFGSGLLTSNVNIGVIPICFMFKTSPEILPIAPVIILLGAIVPAGSLGFSGWLKQLAANLAVFPTVGFMLVLSMWFMGGVFGFGSGAPTEGQLFSPPNLVGGNKAIELMWLGVSFVLFVSTPKAADLIKSMISGQPFNFGTALGEAIMPSKAYTGYALENISTGASPQPLKKLGINVNSRRLDELYGFFHDLGRGQGQWK